MNTMKRSVSLVLFLCLAVSVDMKAQSDAHFNNFLEVENFYNPAAMNRNARTNVVGALSMQMAGYTNAPVSMFIGANTPVLAITRYIQHSVEILTRVAELLVREINQNNYAVRRSG